jgi:hypothetical protein
MKQILLLLSLLLSGLSFPGCSPDVEITPAFVTLDGFDLQTPTIGAATSDITEVWVFADDDYIGAFPLPARIPVLKAGATTMQFIPGVRQNGVTATPDIYPFYSEVVRTLDLRPAETIALGTPTIGYKPEARFSINEGFEAGFPREFTIRVFGDTIILPSQDRVLSGQFSGKIPLTADAPLLEMSSTETFSDLLANSPSVWLEVDFLSDAFINWGVTGFDGQRPIRNFDPITRPRTEWTKIYFNLTEIVVRSNLDEINLNFSALLPDGVTSGDVYLDNIKLIHF